MNIVPVDPTKAFIVTDDNDIPFMTADGGYVVFYREIDAQRFVDRPRFDNWFDPKRQSES